jgi:hypothetical protein
MSVPDDVNIGKEDKREENVKEKMKKKEKKDMERKTMNRRHKKGIYRKKCTGGKYRPTY